MRKSIATLAYTAGIVDGEGTIKLRTNKSYYEVEVFVTNTNEWLIQWLKMQFGGRIYLMKDSSRKPNARDGFRWRLISRQASEFLKLILPYLQIKRPQAELAIAYQKRRRKPWMRRQSKVLDDAQKVLMSHYNKRGQ